MCRRVSCADCGKPTFSGCGMHVEQVLADVPRQDRCTCAEERKKKKDVASPSMLRRLLGLD